jgi:hypothetical protein
MRRCLRKQTILAPAPYSTTLTDGHFNLEAYKLKQIWSDRSYLNTVATLHKFIVTPGMIAKSVDGIWRLKKQVLQICTPQRRRS